MRTCALTTLLTVLAGVSSATEAGGQVIDLTGKDMRPLLQVQAVGSDIAGHPFETDLFIYHGGATFLVFTGTTGDSDRVARGLATSEALVALNRELAAAHVGTLRGRCGTPAPDHIAQYRVTWYGKQRLRTLPIGGDSTDCPAAERRVLEAICSFLWRTLGPSPEYCVPAVP